MKFRCKLPLTLIVLGISVMLGQTVLAETRLGLHVTQEELNIWRERAKRGPYKSTGDVSKNSPGDWDRIAANARKFKSNPSAERVKGQPANKCLQKRNSGDPGDPGGGTDPKQGWLMRDAAFYYLITEERSYADAARKELLAQAKEPGVNFKDGSRFCGVFPTTNGAYLAYTHWLLKMAFTYDYIKDTMSASEKEILREWFLSGARWWHTRVIKEIKDKWSNRDTFSKDSDYTTPRSGNQGFQEYAYVGGPKIYGFNTAWSNTHDTAMRMIGTIGILFNDKELKESAKRFVKEFHMFATYPEGATDDFKRNADDNYAVPCKGLGYSGGQIVDMTMLTDHFARAGDTSLYTYETTHGFYGSEGQDQLSRQPKSLRTTILWYQYYIQGKFDRYSTKKGNSAFKIDDVCAGTKPYISDAQAGPIANVFYKDENIKQGYLRVGTGGPGYPAVPSAGSGGWGAHFAAYPGILFMFGQMENKVWPYPKLGPPTMQIASPLHLRLMQ